MPTPILSKFAKKGVLKETECLFDLVCSCFFFKDEVKKQTSILQKNVFIKKAK